MDWLLGAGFAGLVWGYMVYHFWKKQKRLKAEVRAKEQDQEARQWC